MAKQWSSTTLLIYSYEQDNIFAEKKKFFISITILAIISLFTVSYTFAANNGMDNMVNGIRNFVGGAENVVEDAGRGAVDGIRDGMNTIENGANNMGNSIENGTRDMTNMNSNDRMSNNSGYTATRTSATNNTFMGMNATAWTWLIMGIAAIAIIALVWYYSMQLRSSNYDGRD